MKINEIKYGFLLQNIREVKDINATLYEYVHLKSGGKVVYLANDDTNCCFAIGFKTIPNDSTGVCHIIEHSLLCGSKKYPLKEPFVNLIKGSLATFLNAFTAYDWTMYPCASQNLKDFDNIVDVYLDAVFNPLSMSDPKPFLQEGWHLELLNEKDTPSYKGVVYNEMKGAMSNVDEILVQATLEAMYKDTSYRFNSGGDPKVIPTLTYQAYQDFYHKHYTPENAMTYFYGKLDIESKLKYLDEQYFNKFTKTNKPIKIEVQKPFINLNYTSKYAISSDESLKDNTYMSLCYGLDSYNNYEEFMAINVLMDALLSSNDSPLKKALLDANLGQNVECRLDDDNIKPALHIYLQKTNPNKKELFKKVFEDSVRKLVKEGLDKELLLASINHLEFKDKELDMGATPKGLIFAMILMGSFNYDGDLISHLEFNKYYQLFKEKLYDNYFEKILDKYILNSNHMVEVTLLPSNTLANENNEKQALEMQELKKKLSKKEIKDLVKQTKELLAYQNHVDSKKELATLPSLKLKDISLDVNYLASKRFKTNGYHGITHNINTNGIGYLRMYFNLNCISVNDLPYVLLLKELLTNVATRTYDVTKLNKVIKTFLGDLDFVELILSDQKDIADFYFKISTSALDENINYIPEILNEVLLHSKFTTKEVLQIAKQITNDLKQQIINSGMNIAMSLARSAFSKEASLSVKAFKGPEVYNFFNNLVTNYNHKAIKAKLKELVTKIFNKNNAFVSLSGNETTINLLKDSLKKLKMPNKYFDSILDVSLNSIKSEALVVPSMVSYNAMSSSLENFNQKFNGSHLVLSHIVSYDYLWPEIRVKGGAYGANLVITRNNDITFGTYRDPNVKNSYEAFKNIVNYLKNFKVTKKEFLTYIIGTLGGFDSPLSTPSTINVADVNYLRGYSKKDKIKLKKEVLKTTMNDIVSFATLFEKMFKKAKEFTVGEESKIKEYSFTVVNKL